MQLRLVMTVVEEEANIVQEDEDRLLRGTKVLLELVEPWSSTDSFFRRLSLCIGRSSRYFEENWATIHWCGEDNEITLPNEVIVRDRVSQ